MKLFINAKYTAKMKMKLFIYIIQPNSSLDITAVKTIGFVENS